MRLTSLGAMLDELQAVLTAKGCRLTEVSVTFCPVQDGEEMSVDADVYFTPRCYPTTLAVSDGIRRTT